MSPVSAMPPRVSGATVSGMANFPADLSYTKNHEWLRLEGDRATVGITYHGQRQLGAIVFADLPKAGDRFEANEPFGWLESDKAETPPPSRLLPGAAVRRLIGRRLALRRVEVEALLPGRIPGPFVAVD